MAFSSNFFGAITHRGGRDARVPVRAASRQWSATPMGDTVWNINTFSAPSGRGQASPLQRQRFLVLGDRNSGACWRSSVGLRRHVRLPTPFVE
ncbi:MAG: hypothetical protein LBQ66_14350 [Planctomycetaceae bacterium]|nr:hypothetical protein [Planctomycetaceae bacterium]